MYREIKREPLGIRKLDVQEDRRNARRELEKEAERMFRFWFKDAPLAMPLTEENLIRFAHVLLMDGWEKGVTVGASRTRDRVRESLENGRLVKTR